MSRLFRVSILMTVLILSVAVIWQLNSTLVLTVGFLGTPPARPAAPKSYFQQATDKAVYELQQPLSNTTIKRNTKFNIEEWKNRTDGGLVDADRILLAKMYGQAESVFEFGLGESTFIANHMGVPYYAGIDSDAAWVAMARSQAPSHFRFYFADIGPTQLWGYPVQHTRKGWIQYQLGPLLAEQRAFDVYMVDGRWRVPTALLCFLHASDRSRGSQTNTTVLLHDCPLKGVTPDGIYKSRYRPEYERLNEVLERVEHSGGVLCVYKRRPQTTDQDLWNLWQQVYDRNI